MSTTRSFDLDLAQRSMWRYRSRFPVASDSSPITLGEGQTPLLRARSGPDGLTLFYKNETLNPTGSQKDRALSLSITKGVELGHKAVMLYSDGSTALSSAAYATRAGLRSLTLVGRGAPDYRLLPLAFYNSTVLEYQGSSAEALAWTREACQALNIYETTTYRKANPYGGAGLRTISYEIAEQLGDAPAWIVVPVGGGGTLCSIWNGFRELRERGEISRYPRMAAVFPAGYSLLERTMANGICDEEAFRSMAIPDPPETIQAKTAMALPPDGLETIEAIRESNGLIFYCTDEQAIDGQMLLGREGIFAEPSAASVMVGVEALSALGLGPEEAVVAVVTGSGFRELGAIAESVSLKKYAIEPITGLNEIRRLLHGF
jgi:threonine synthase